MQKSLYQQDLNDVKVELTVLNTYSSRFHLILPAGIGLVVLAALGYWGGIPSKNQGLFFLGIGSLLIMMILTITLGWLLLATPNSETKYPISGKTVGVGPRQFMALALTVSSINIVVGGFWDEVWHRKYHIPFGDDFFWRPHLMLYFGLILVILLALWSVWLLGRQEGSWRQRFRRNPALSFLLLLGGFLTYIVPADPIWHFIYGNDISAWSLPHILLALSFALISIAAIAILVSTLVEKQWGFLGLNPADGICIIALAFAFTVSLQLMTTEWDSIRVISRYSPYIFWQRPEWLLPAVIAFIATFFAVFATYVTRRIGSATAVGILALSLRFALLSIFDLKTLSADTWLVSLPIFLTVDALAVLNLRVNNALRWWQVGLSAALSMTFMGLFLLSKLFIYPEVKQQTLPMMVIMIGLMSLFASWCAIQLSKALNANKMPEETMPSHALLWISPLGIILMIVFIAYFIATAQPPFGIRG